MRNPLYFDKYENNYLENLHKKKILDLLQTSNTDICKMKIIKENDILKCNQFISNNMFEKIISDYYFEFE